MNKELLHRYLLFMLSDEKVAIVLLKGQPDVLSGIAEGILKAASTLPVYFAEAVLERLETITVNNSEAGEKVAFALRRLKKERFMQKLFPWLALAITVILCVAMYFFSKK